MSDLVPFKKRWERACMSFLPYDTKSVGHDVSFPGLQTVNEKFYYS